MLKFTLSLFFILTFGFAASAQTVSGKVTDSSDGSPVFGASVLLVGTFTGTATDTDGNFTLTASQGAELEISFVGYKTVRVTVGSGTLNVSLEPSSRTLDEVVISVGSRNSKRTLTDTPLPIDILSAKELTTTGQSTFDKALTFRVPSFNAVQTPVNDATSLLDPYEIRNMGPSRTLILINGKRKNLSSLVYIQTSPGRGETGADISSIPTDAVKRVEILRDGASAQYGSDAIAGVMNIILKDNVDEGSVILNTGITGEGDGELLGINFNNGSKLGKNGFLNYTVSFQQQGLANRPGTVDAAGEASDFGASLSDVQTFLAEKPDAGNINGSPKTTAAKFLVNGGIETDEKSELYFNAAYVYKKVNSYANYRTPYWRPTDFGLLTPAGQPYNGYVPTFEGNLADYNGTIGYKTEKNAWKSDVSLTVGGNQQTYNVNNSVNRDLGKLSPIQFRPGGYDFSHLVGNIDVSKQLTDKVSFAFGSEFRSERFEILQGDTSSFSGGGADSFSGLGPSNAVIANRYNFGGYVDFGFDFTEEFLINATARLENYSDFGNAFVWKVSSRYMLMDDKLTVRASYSTGFRAPTLHQIYANTTKYGFVPGQGIQISGFVNNVSPQAKLLGVPKLKAEESINFTAGLAYNPTENFSFTADYYNITVNDRILLSSEIGPGGTAQSAALDAVLSANNIVSVSFFVNGLDTQTSGIDLVASYRNLTVGPGTMSFNLSGNLMLSNEIVGGLANGIKNPTLIANAGASVFDATQESLMLTSRPKFKTILGIDYQLDKFAFNLNNTVFGPTEFRNSGLDSNLKIEFLTKIVSDISVMYRINKKSNFTLSVNNFLNITPEWEFVALNSEGEKVLADPAAVKSNSNLITFNQRYPMVTYDGSHFSQLGTTFNASFRFGF